MPAVRSISKIEIQIASRYFKDLSDMLYSRATTIRALRKKPISIFAKFFIFPVANQPSTQGKSRGVIVTASEDFSNII